MLWICAASVGVCVLITTCACRYLYITIVYNITYSVALFALFVFYKGAHTLLAPFNPMLKFLLVKSVVFFTFWQVGPIPGPGTPSGARVNNTVVPLLASAVPISTTPLAGRPRLGSSVPLGTLRKDSAQNENCPSACKFCLTRQCRDDLYGMTLQMLKSKLQLEQ